VSRTQERRGANRFWWGDMRESYRLLDMVVDGNSRRMDLQVLEWRVGLGLD